MAIFRRKTIAEIEAETKSLEAEKFFRDKERKAIERRDALKKEVRGDPVAGLKTGAVRVGTGLGRLAVGVQRFAQSRAEPTRRIPVQRPRTVGKKIAKKATRRPLQRQPRRVQRRNDDPFGVRDIFSGGI